MFCRQCGHELKENETTCENCGYDSSSVIAPKTVREKSAKAKEYEERLLLHDIWGAANVITGILIFFAVLYLILGIVNFVGSNIAGGIGNLILTAIIVWLIFPLRKIIKIVHHFAEKTIDKNRE